MPIPVGRPRAEWRWRLGRWFWRWLFGREFFFGWVRSRSDKRPDGSTIFSPSGLVFQALATRNGGEVISADSY